MQSKYSPYKCDLNQYILYIMQIDHNICKMNKVRPSHRAVLRSFQSQKTLKQERQGRASNSAYWVQRTHCTKRRKGERANVKGGAALGSAMHFGTKEQALQRTVDEKTDFSGKNQGDLFSLRKVSKRLGMHPEV